MKLVNALTESLEVAVAAGDLGVAKMAHEALGRVLAGGESMVTDLGEERVKRGRGGR